MRYINYKCPFTNTIETVDHFESLKEAKTMLNEYNLISSNYYISQRPCQDYWDN